MPTVADYGRLAPFNLDELVEATNSVLRYRPRLQTTRRMVRYYVGAGVLPAPTGSPKFARYGLEHIVRLVGSRCLQDRGHSLEEAKAELDERLAEGLAIAVRHVDSLVTDRPGASNESAEAGAMRRVLALDESELPIERVARIRLGAGLYLEMADRRLWREALAEARDSLDRLLATDAAPAPLSV